MDDSKHTAEENRSVTVRDVRRNGRLTLRLLGGGVAGAWLAVACEPESWMVGLLLPLGGAVAAWLLERRVASPWAWRLDVTGLHEMWFGGRRVVHPWSSIREVVEHPREIVIRTDTGLITVPRQGSDAEALLQRLRERDAVPVEHAPIRPEQIAEWLGIAPDSDIPTPADRSWIPLAAALLLMVVFAVLVLNTYFGPVVVMAAFALIYSVQDRLSDVRVTPYGFYNRGRLVGRWADVAGPLGGQHRNELRLLGKTWVLAYNQREPVERTIDRVLEARRAGVEISRLDGVPDTAISPAEHDPISAELGLSRADE